MEAKEDSPDKRIHSQSQEIETIDSIETLSSGETTRHVPQEIIEEILLRLPVKTLLRFKCVAKAWLALISSPKFIKAHLTCSALDPTFSNHRLMFQLNKNLKHCSVSCIFRGVLTDAVGVDCPNVRANWRFKISGSCNGLLLVSVIVDEYSLDDLFLWNPSLKMSKKLPLTCVPEWEVIRTPTYGICYDEPSDDYKVVLLLRHANDAIGETMVVIYSLRNDSWKRIKGFNGGKPLLDSSMIYANGKFHFLAYFENDNLSTGRWNIVSLDLGNEVYGTVELPEITQPKHSEHRSILLSIGVLKGCISALYTYEAQDYTDLWALKEYGVRESWTKVVRIPHVDGYIGCCLRSQILGVSTNGEVLLHHSSSRPLLVYNPEDDSFVRPQICDLGLIFSMGIYVESLVPLPSNIIISQVASKH